MEAWDWALQCLLVSRIVVVEINDVGIALKTAFLDPKHMDS